MNWSEGAWMAGSGTTTIGPTAHLDMQPTAPAGNGHFQLREGRTLNIDGSASIALGVNSSAPAHANQLLVIEGSVINNSGTIRKVDGTKRRQSTFALVYICTAWSLFTEPPAPKRR